MKTFLTYIKTAGVGCMFPLLLLLFASKTTEAQFPLTISPSSFEFDSGGGSQSCSIRAEENWRVRSHPDWITIDPDHGDTDDRVTIYCAENRSSSSRTGSIVIADSFFMENEIYISQDAGSGIDVGCSSLTLPGEGGSQSCSITSNVSWTAGSSATSWLTVSPSSGNGNGTITISCKKNTTASSRSGTITVSGSGITKTISISQPVAPYISASCNNTLFESSGGSSTCTISTNQSSWNVSSLPGYISNVSISGNTLSFTCDANTEPEIRSGNIVLYAGSTSTTTSIIIYQEGCALPTATASGGGTICYGESRTLRASGTATTYTWTPGNHVGATYTVGPISTTTYTVIGSNSCGESSGSTVTVTVNPSPLVGIIGNRSICKGDCTTLTAKGASSYKWSNGATSSSITVCPTTTTTYTVTGTSSSGCKSTDSATVTVNSSLPTISVNGTTNICKGDCSTLTATGASSYRWNNGATGSSITVCPTATTTYTVTGTNSGGCESTASATVTVDPSPLVAIIGNRAICKGDCITLTATGASSYKWSNGATSSSITVCPTATTTYTVTGTNASGCSSTDVVEVIVNPAPTITGVTPGTRCGSGTVTLRASASSGTINWYALSSGGVSLHSGTTFTTPPLSTTITYYVDATNGTCTTTTRTPVTATINAIPSITGVTSNSKCGSGTVTLGATASSGTINWYASSTGGVSLHSGSTFTTPPLSATTTYYVDATNGTCTTTTRTAVTASVYTESTPPSSIISDINTPCPGETVLLQTEGGSLGTDASWQWYDSPDFSSSIATGTSLYVAPREETTYYVRGEGSCNVTDAVSLTVYVEPVTAGAIYFENSISYKPIVNNTIISTEDARAGNCGFGYSWEQAAKPEPAGAPLEWELISGATQAFYTIEKLNTSTYFRRGATDNKGNQAYTGSLFIQVIDTLVTAPSALQYNAGKLTVHKGKYGKNGKWQWYNSYKGSTYAESSDSVLEVSVTRSTRFRARSEYWVKTKDGDSIKEHSYFVSARVQANESLEADDSQNYIISYTPVKGYSSEDSISGLPLEEQGAVVQYYDGLGRPTQTVAANQSYYFNDLVSGVGYDEYGRRDKVYIPSTRHGQGAPVSDLDENIASFYSGTEGNVIDGLLSGRDYNYTYTDYEASPLNRVLGVTDPKNGTTSYAYGTNMSGEIIIWSVDDSGNCTSDGTYGAGELYTTQTTDPEGKTVKEYKDKLGQVVLKVAGGTAKTYYVYDDFGLLRYVLSPEASAAMTGSSYSSSDAVVKGLCYYYEYDRRKRMVEKQLPGAKPVYMVYDSRDRLVLIQDGKTRTENVSPRKWMYTLYDNLNRPVQTGWLTTTQSDFGQVQAAFNLVSELNDVSDLPSGYTPVEVLTQTTYDSYPGAPEGNISANQSVKGMVTRTKSRILGTNNFTRTDFFYDNKYRVIQTIIKEVNSSGSVLTDLINRTTTNTYDFAGNLLTSTETYSGEVNQTVYKYYTYDHAGRLEKAEQEIAGDTHNGKVVLATMDYNELGQIMLKKMHNAKDTSFVQDIDYLYDVRGWLKSINNFTGTTSRKLYAQSLDYYDNGNISAMKWKNTLLDENDWISPANRQQYAFSYDGLNRLTGAAYSEYDPSNSSTVNSGNFTTAYNYYPNGNIHTLSRQGNLNTSEYDPSYGTIDNLTYAYNTNSNQLSTVNDAVSSVNHDLQYVNGSGSYSHDDNGNATYIPNKGINISYNYLNLPDSIGSIAYLYDALGNKVKKSYGGIDSYYQGSVLTVNEQEVILTGEGRVVNNGGWQYEYDLKDHLGNTRVSFKVDTIRAVPLQYKDYYPFGMEMANWYATVGTPTKFLYNGKELQDEGGLDWYDYQARMYDPALGRFTTIDPLTENFASITPYNYVANNPIVLIDPDGRAWRPTNTDDENPNGYEWVPEEDSYDDDGNLLDGLYAQAIFFTDNGTFDENSDYNMGSATAVVYLADGTKVEYDANTRPSDGDAYATVPEGRYEGKVGTHNGSYTALRTGDVGTQNFGPGNNTIELGYENPAYSDGRTYATGINIHKAGLNNKTGMTNSGSPISAGCSLIDRDNWSGFIGNFDTDAQRNNTISVSISRTYSTPLNFNVTTPTPPTTRVDNTRVVIPYRQ